MKTYPSL